MTTLSRRLMSAARRVEHEAALWRDEPIRRVYLLNRPLHPIRSRQFHRFGEGSVLHRPQWLYGTHKIAVGSWVIALERCWFAVERQAWDNPGPVLTIGDAAAFRAGVTISAAESIVIEDHVCIAAYST